MKNLRMSFLIGCLSTFLLIGSMAAGQSKNSFDLDEDISVVSTQISETEKENDEYSGGLIKALITYRLQILKNTKAMLEQKKYAFNHGIPVTYTYKGEIYKATPPDPTLIRSLESEIRHQQEELSKAKAENAKYSGGLLKAMILAQVATIKNTIAILEQRKLTEKYGVPLFALSEEEFEEAASAPQPPTWVVVVKKANVRGGPGTEYTKLFQLRRFDEFEVIDSEGEWLRIMTEDKREGWLHKKLSKAKSLLE